MLQTSQPIRSRTRTVTAKPKGGAAKPQGCGCEPATGFAGHTAGADPNRVGRISRGRWLMLPAGMWSSALAPTGADDSLRSRLRGWLLDNHTASPGVWLALTRKDAPSLHRPRSRRDAPS